MKTARTTLARLAAGMFLIFATTSTAAPKDEESDWFKKTFSRLEWNDIPSAVATPKEICKKVRAAVEFREERGDQWATGAETWKRGWGDCEDLAACVMELCHTLNLEAKIVIFVNRGSRDAHAVVIGNHNGQMWLSSNGWFTNVDDMQEAKAEVADEMGWETRNVYVTSLRNAM